MSIIETWGDERAVVMVEVRDSEVGIPGVDILKSGWNCTLIWDGRTLFVKCICLVR